MWKILRNLPSLVEPLMEPLMEPGFDVQNWSRERSGGTQKRVKGARFGKKKPTKSAQKGLGFCRTLRAQKVHQKLMCFQAPKALPRSSVVSSLTIPGHLLGMLIDDSMFRNPSTHFPSKCLEIILQFDLA